MIIKLLQRFLHGFALIALTTSALALDVQVLYLQKKIENPPVLSNILPEPQDSGKRGAELAIIDNNTTGRFLKQNFELSFFESTNDAALVDYAKNWIRQGNFLMLLDLPAETLLKLALSPGIAGEAILFNISAPDDQLRRDQCLSGLLHTIPSRAMLSDALMQFLVRKRWQNWFLIQASKPEDAAFATSMKRASKRYGGKLIAEKSWTFDTDQRRSAQLEIPGFSQVDDYDIAIIADEAGDIGEYILFNTWLPRPVGGTQGLKPLAWHRVVEQWGAAQLQNRFTELSGRWMNSKDYAAWLALRSIGEAITRSKSPTASQLYAYLLSDKFKLAGFKGRKLSFRDWNGQMRQPIPLVHPRALVSVSPQEGFLHPFSELDTLGFDRPEVNCQYKTRFPENS
ncbi:MAG: ABC transporter substrate-binding protein [Gammaproteobacteria bacterium]|nr:ABC transporter substrate-binding protein [Gammaproteobacteria bacterium]